MLFIDIVRSGYCRCAVNLLRTSAEPLKLAMQRDGSDDTVLSWAAYKANNTDVSWIELVCQLLILCPSDIRKRSTNGFLPLHDAGWGCAPSEIATLLCSAFPGALDDKVNHETPHQVCRYHACLKRSCFTWRPSERMLEDAMDLRSDVHWLQTIASLRLSQFPELHTMSIEQMKHRFGVPQSIAQLVASFFQIKPGCLPYRFKLASIPEDLTVGLLAVQRRSNQGVYISRKQPPRGRTLRGVPEVSPIDEVDHVREVRAKNEGHYAGVRRVRRGRCPFKQSLCVRDGSGRMHHIELHCVRTMPKHLRRLAKQAKWPSKAGVRRDRARERDDKASDRNQL
jgi:hypothetical protein